MVSVSMAFSKRSAQNSQVSEPDLSLTSQLAAHHFPRIAGGPCSRDRQRNNLFETSDSVSLFLFQKNEPRIKIFEKLFRIKESRNSFFLKIDSNQRIREQSFRITDSNQ